MKFNKQQKQWLQVNNLWKAVKENIGECDISCTDKYTTLVTAFSWDMTPEGYAFWSGINRRMRDELNGHTGTNKSLSWEELHKISDISKIKKLLKDNQESEKLHVLDQVLTELPTALFFLGVHTKRDVGDLTVTQLAEQLENAPSGTTIIGLLLTATRGNTSVDDDDTTSADDDTTSVDDDTTSADDDTTSAADDDTTSADDDDTTSADDGTTSVEHCNISPSLWEVIVTHPGHVKDIIDMLKPFKCARLVHLLEELDTYPRSYIISAVLAKGYPLTSFGDVAKYLFKNDISVKDFLMR